MDSLNSASWRKSSYSGNDNSTECVEVATWRKATYNGNGNDNPAYCVESADCVEGATWRKANHSGSDGNCVEAGIATRGRVLVRDTTDRDGTVLDLPADAWDRFTASLR